jgi:hypothetical protein
MEQGSGLLFALLIVSGLEQGIEFPDLHDPLACIRITGKQIFNETPLLLIQFTIHIGEQQYV